jgi:hypothetical protein
MNNKTKSVLALTAVLGGVLGILLLSLPTAAQQRSNARFEHFRSGFPMTGAHAQAECESCHALGVFKGTPTQCELCHVQGSRTGASGKPATHIPTSMACNMCHTSTVSWTGARYRHIGVAPASCMQCHNGSMAPGKHATHIQTTSSCDQCHRTTAWVPASYNHATVAPGTCNTCHGVTATPMPSGHFVTTRSCDACHTTSRWLPARYSHTSAYFSAHNSGVTCSSCHRGNTETITWQYGAYTGFCAGCHAGDFELGPHKKTETPTTTYYTVDELKNCSGSCHIYDGTTGAITKTRNGEHRSTDGGF